MRGEDDRPARTATARSRRSRSTRRYAPIAKDARAILRQKTLLGETYVELTPGNKRAAGTVPDGGMLADAQRGQDGRSSTRSSRRSTRKTRASVPGLAAGLGQGDRAGHGRDLNDALGQPARVRRRRHRPADRARRPAAADSGARPQHRRRCSARSPRTSASCTTSSSRPGRHSTRRRGGRRRWPRRSRSSRRSSTSRRRRSRAWRRFSKDDRPAGPGPAARRSRDLSPTLRDVRALAPDLRRTCSSNLDPLITASKTGLPARTRHARRQSEPLLGRAAAVPRAAQPGAPVPRVPPARRRRTSSPTARRRSADTVPTATAERGRPLPAPVRPRSARRPSRCTRTARRRSAATRTSTPDALSAPGARHGR